MLALQAADTSLCGGLSFNQPRSNSTGTAKYYVYVTSDSNGNAAGTCRSETSSGIRVSYITLWQISNLDYSLTDFEKGVVSHEYMHAIVHDYRDNSALPKWFKESWSEWAIVRVNGLSANTCPVNLVNGYLENSHKSLIDDDDSYGKLLYPLYPGTGPA